METACGDIRRELRVLLESDPGVLAHDVNTRSLTHGDGQWDKVHLWSQGKPHTAALSQCTATAKLIERIPYCKAFGMAYFSRLRAGTVVR